jgi:hypothetical protein
MVNLSQHFTLAELTKTELRKFDNTPPPAVIPNIKRMAEKLERVRELLGGKPIVVNSCYRSKEVNKAVGSKETSKHCEGLAVDFICPSYGTPLAICERIEKSDLQYDQLILEFFNPATGAGWVHLGLGAKTRRQTLTINQQGTFAGLHP